MWTYTILTVFIYLVLGLFLAGCNSTVVKTIHENKPLNDASIYYYLPTSQLTIHTTVKVQILYDPATKDFYEGNCAIIEQQFEVEVETIADTDALLALRYNSSMFSNDHLTYKINSAGLLQSIDITTEDRSSKIVEALTQAPAAILGLSSPETYTTRSNVVVKIKEFKNSFQIPVSKLTGASEDFYWKILIENELKSDAPPIWLENRFNVNLSDPHSRDLESANPDIAEYSEVDGILSRPLKNLELHISTVEPKLNSVHPAMISVIDDSKLIRIPVERSPFVKRENKLTISNGLITDYEVKKPSSFEGFLSIPIDIAKAIVSIPAQLISFRIDNTKREANLLDEELILQKSILESEKFEISREQKLQDELLLVQKAELNNKQALEKLQLELEQVLIEAEKAKLQSQKELDALKEEIEALKKESGK